VSSLSAQESFCQGFCRMRVHANALLGCWEGEAVRQLGSVLWQGRRMAGDADEAS
jgi:hypothetical protein